MPATGIFNEEAYILRGAGAAGIGAVTGVQLDVDDSFEQIAARIQSQAFELLVAGVSAESLDCLAAKFLECAEVVRIRKY